MEEIGKKLEVINSIEQLEIGKQLDSQINVLVKHSSIIEVFPDSGDRGIRGIDGNKYPIPTLKEVMDRLKANEKLILEKANQGFTKLLLVPFAYSLEKLTDELEKTIKDHEGKLLATKNEATDPDEPLVVGEMGALLKQGFYSDCDINSKIIYFPNEFSKNHQGKTKLELLRAGSTNAWQIWLLEDMPNIPREGEGRIIGGRRQLEAGKSPDEYLKILQTKPEYKGESGLTPEVELMLFLTYLEETNQVINDYEGNGSTSCQIGAYFKSVDSVPHLLWFRYRNQLWLTGINTNRYYSETGFEPRTYGYYSKSGTRSGVRV